MPSLRNDQRSHPVADDSSASHRKASDEPSNRSVPGVPTFLRHTGVPVIQRQPLDAGLPATGPVPRDAGDFGRSGVTSAVPAGPPSTTGGAPRFDFDMGIHLGPNFDATYQPVGPVPAEGVLTIDHRVFIRFLPFATRLIRENPRMFGRYRGVRFTAAQRAEFAWTAAQQETFRNDFVRNVHEVWSGRHRLALNEAGFSPYRARVEVNVTVADADEDAHSVLTAYKMPPGAPRLRSEVRSDHTATLESRDPSEPTHHSVFPNDFVRQVGPFDFDSAAVVPPVEAGVQEVAGLVRGRIDVARHPEALDAACMTFQGRATSEGSTTYNEELGRRRARAVRTRLFDVLGVPLPATTVEFGEHPGERHATTDSWFRRVDVLFDRDCRPFEDTEQNVAAHEFGHLIGFGDEYADETPPSGVLPKFLADRPTHYSDVESEVGQGAADELLVQGSGSIMSEGNTVRRGHYVYFLRAIEAISGKDWAVES